jgi:hypothetical protein
MQIKNTGTHERALSRDGVNIPLMPGAAVELPLTDDEATAFRGIGFEVTGEPTKAEKKGRAE